MYIYGEGLPQCFRGKESTSNAVPGLGRFPEGGDGNPLQYSCWGNPMDREALETVVHRIARSQI